MRISYYPAPSCDQCAHKEERRVAERHTQTCGSSTRATGHIAQPNVTKHFLPAALFDGNIGTRILIRVHMIVGKGVFMFSSVRAAYIQGIKSIGVDVQADVSSGLPVDLAKRSGCCFCVIQLSNPREGSAVGRIVMSSLE